MPDDLCIVLLPVGHFLFGKPSRKRICSANSVLSLPGVSYSSATYGQDQWEIRKPSFFRFTQAYRIVYPGPFGNATLPSNEQTNGEKRPIVHTRENTAWHVLTHFVVKRVLPKQLIKISKS